MFFSDGAIVVMDNNEEDDSALRRELNARIGRNLEMVALAAGWSLEALAEQLDVDVSLLRAIGAGDVRPDGMLLVRASILLRVEVSSLFKKPH